MAQNLPPIIHLNKDGDVQRQQGQRAPQNLPPPPFLAIPQDLRPRGNSHHGAPRNMRPQNHQGTQMPQPYFPNPPMQAIPQDLRPHQPPAMKAVEIVDIRNEGLTPADARERLSEYIIIRLEKTDNFHDVDQLGFPMKSTWERVKRSTLTDISQQEARHRVLVLQQQGKSVGEKKASLSIPVQRQLERAKESLERSDIDRRFQYNLVQFDQKLRPIHHGELEYSGKHHKKSKKSRNHSSSKKLKKLKYEMVAITAYFKRTPKSGQNALLMLEEQEREKNMRVVPPIQRQAPARENAPAFNQSPPANSQRVMHQKPIEVMQVNVNHPKQPQTIQPQKPDFPKAPQAMPPQKDLPKQPQGMPLQKDLPKQPQGMPPQGQPPQGKPPQDMQQQKTDLQRNPQVLTEVKKQPNPAQDKNLEKQGKGQIKAAQLPLNIQSVKPNKTDKHIVGSPGSSKGSFDSTSSSVSDASTSASSLGSSSEPSKYRRGRSRTPVYRNDRANYGVTVPARKHSRHEEREYIFEDAPQRYTNTASVPKSSTRGSIRDSPYPGVHERHIGYDSRTAPTPRILQANSRIRRVTGDEVRRVMLEDTLKKIEDRIRRMRLNDMHSSQDSLLDDQRLDLLGEELQYRKSLKEELRNLPYTERDAAEYMRERTLEHSFPRERRGILRKN